MDGEQLKTLADLNYFARKDYGIVEPLLSRMIAFTQALASRDSAIVKTFVDANRVTVPTYLGMMAATNDGKYWANLRDGNGKSIFDRFSSEFGTSVLAVAPPNYAPAPTPVPVPAPVPDPVVTPPAPGAIVPIHGEAVPTNLSGDALTVIRALEELNVYVRRNKIAVGMLPIANNPAGLQVGGDAAATIVGMSNATPDGYPRRVDPQNPGEVHINLIHIADTDGGSRVTQYAQWLLDAATGAVTKVRNTLNRSSTTVALMDSYGDMCCSDDRVPRGQIWYIVKRVAEGFADFCTYQKGHRPRLMAAGAEYAANDVKVIEEVVRRILAEKGL